MGLCWELYPDQFLMNEYLGFILSTNEFVLDIAPKQIPIKTIKFYITF